MKQATLQYTAHTPKTGYRLLEKARHSIGLLYNIVISRQVQDPETHYILYDRKATGKLITELLRNGPEFQGYAHKLATAVEKRAFTPLSAHLKYLKDLRQGIVSIERGRPHTQDPYRNRTLEISEPAVKHLTVSESGRKATIRIKGLPDIHFRPDHRLPKDVQPRKIAITMTAKRLNANLTFRAEDLNRDWPEATKHSIGVDPGVKHTLTTADSEGEITHLPGIDSKELRKIKELIRRKLQRQRDQAVRDGRARWVTRRKGKLKHRFRWNGPSSKSYRKTLARLRKVEQTSSDSRKGRLHRITTKLVQTYSIICWEDTRIRNMTKSGKGTAEEPGKNVAQKSGLARQMVEYKASWAGRTFVAVPAAYTSQTCNNCQNVCADSRRTQDKYVCVACGYEQQADANAAENIRRQGVNSLGRAEGPYGDLREPPETPSGVTTATRPKPAWDGPCSLERSRQLRLIP